MVSHLTTARRGSQPAPEAITKRSEGRPVPRLDSVGAGHRGDTHSLTASNIDLTGLRLLRGRPDDDALPFPNGSGGIWNDPAWQAWHRGSDRPGGAMCPQIPTAPSACRGSPSSPRRCRRRSANRRLKRLVIDASALVSGITGSRSENPPCQIYDAVSEMSVEAIICPRLLAEVKRVLRKPYFRELIPESCRRRGTGRVGSLSSSSHGRR